MKISTELSYCIVLIVFNCALLVLGNTKNVIFDSRHAENSLETPTSQHVNATLNESHDAHNGFNANGDNPNTNERPLSRLDFLKEEASHDNSMPPFSSRYSSEYNSEIIRNEIEPIILPANLVTSCRAFINAYSIIAANYTACTILYARPFRICGQCIEEYLLAHQYSTVILQHVNAEGSSKSCWNNMGQADRVHVIKVTARFIDDLWDDSECHNCYEYYGVDNETMSYQLKNETITFFEKARDTMACFFNHTENHSKDIEGIVNLDEQLKKKVRAKVCTACQALYADMNTFYEHLRKKYHRKVCMDIDDKMNMTRSIWSDELKCNIHPSSLVVVFVIIGFWCLMPLLFYPGVKFLRRAAHEVVIPQRRYHHVSNRRMHEEN